MAIFAVQYIYVCSNTFMSSYVYLIKYHTKMNTLKMFMQIHICMSVTKEMITNLNILHISKYCVHSIDCRIVTFP